MRAIALTAPPPSPSLPAAPPPAPPTTAPPTAARLPWSVAAAALAAAAVTPTAVEAETADTGAAVAVDAAITTGGPTPWMGYFVPWGTPFPPQPRAPWVLPNAVGVLGPRPGASQHAYPLMYAGPGAPPQPSWDQAALYSAMNQLSVQQPGSGDWVFDSGASSHVTGNAGNLTTSRPVSKQHPPIIVGDSTRLPVVATGTASLSTSSLFTFEQSSSHTRYHPKFAPCR